MPKLKTHKGAAKRFKVTKTGKVKANSSNRGHFMTEKSPSRKRKLRKGTYLEKTQATTIKKMINR